MRYVYSRFSSYINYFSARTTVNKRLMLKAVILVKKIIFLKITPINIDYIRPFKENSKSLP